MKNENINALKETLQAYAQNPTYGHEMQISMLISIATSLAVIADRMCDNNDMAESEDEE